MSKNKYTVRAVYCTAKQADALEKALILKYKPRDNSVKYEMFTSKEDERYTAKVVDAYFETPVTDDLPY